MKKPGRLSAFWAFWGGLYLIALYFATIWVAVGALSAIQVRADLESNPTEARDGRTEVRTFADVKHAYVRFTKQQELIDRRLANSDPSLTAYLDVDMNLRLIAAELGLNPDTIIPFEFEQSDTFREVSESCGVPDPNSPNDLKEIAVADDLVCNLVRMHVDLTQAAFAKYDQMTIDATFEKASGEAQRQLDELRNGETLRRHFDDYTFFVSMKYDRFLHMPRHVMVLLLTMAMGALGSVVTMTWLFVRQDSGLTMRRFVILPFIGTMSAFIILIFLSAGQLTLNAGDSDVGLNPFVLSFVGVISGVLSERAYLRISDIGTNFFAVDDGQPRWGFRLQAALAEAGVTLAELARHLGTTEEEAGRIVSESTTATLPQQRMIAACLRRPVREMFTDVPPEGPITTTSVLSIDTPDLIGLDPAQVEEKLHPVGLLVGNRTEVPATSVDPGLIQGQSPAPGKRVPLRTHVHISIAMAPTLTDPDPDRAPEPPPAPANT